MALSDATILTDAQTAERIDVLPGRGADALERWLRTHSGVEIVCRDGSGAYGEAIRRAVPDAVQVSDRWHVRWILGLPIRWRTGINGGMDLDEAVRFAGEWAADWNSHDLDRITRHYSDDVVFSSPVAARIIDGSDGVVRGIKPLRAYWAEGLRRNPDLRFEVVGVYTGVDTVVINFRQQTGQLSAEVLIFRDGVVVSGMGTHGAQLS